MQSESEWTTKDGSLQANAQFFHSHTILCVYRRRRYTHKVSGFQLRRVGAADTAIRAIVANPHPVKADRHPHKHKHKDTPRKGTSKSLAICSPPPVEKTLLTSCGVGRHSGRGAWRRVNRPSTHASSLHRFVPTEVPLAPAMHGIRIHSSRSASTLHDHHHHQHSSVIAVRTHARTLQHITTNHSMLAQR